MAIGHKPILFRVSADSLSLSLSLVSSTCHSHTTLLYVVTYDLTCFIWTNRQKVTKKVKTQNKNKKTPTSDERERERTGLENCAENRPCLMGPIQACCFIERARRSQLLLLLLAVPLRESESPPLGTLWASFCGVSSRRAHRPRWIAARKSRRWCTRWS